MSRKPAEVLVSATDTAKELFAIYLCVVVAAAFAFVHFEAMSFLDAMWMTLVTATTTGYGDLYPKTPAGRVVAVLLMHTTTLFIIPLVTARLASKLIVDNDAFTHSEQEEIKETLREIRERLRHPS